jgi:hypothetical protein
MLSRRATIDDKVGAPSLGVAVEERVEGILFQNII